MPWAAIAGAAVGAIAGGQKDRSGGFSDTRSTQSIQLRNFDDLNKGRSGLEELGYNQQLEQFKQLLGLVGQGPGAAEVSANTAYQNQFAGQLQALLGEMSYRPPGAVTNQAQADQLRQYQGNIANNYREAQALYAPQQEALNQQFQDQAVQANRLSARLGRPGNDPILRNKLAQEQTRQQSMLNAEIGAYGRQLPSIRAEQLMGVGGYLSNLRQGLASQALQNRQTLLSLGNELTNSERQYRLNTATRTGSQTTDQNMWSGGGTKGALQGGLAGFGMGMGMGGAFSSGASPMSMNAQTGPAPMRGARFMSGSMG